MESSNESASTAATADVIDPSLDQSPAAVADQTPASAQTVVTEPRSDGARGTRSSRRSSRSHRSHRGEHSPHLSTSEISRSKRRHQLWATRLIALAAIITSVVLSLLLIHARSHVASYHLDNKTLASELNRTRSKLVQTEQLVADQELELGTLLKRQIPGVTEMELEKLYEINNKQVKSLSFFEAGVGADKRLTYNVLLKNTDEVPVIPAVTILLFDRKGLQTGLARVTREAATTPTQREQLQPGETRAYSAPIESIRKDAPIYFMVEVR